MHYREFRRLMREDGLTLATAILTAVSRLAPGSASAAQPPPPSSTVVLALHPQNTNCVLGKPVFLTVTLSNLDDRPLSLRTFSTWGTRQSSFPVGDLEVTNAAGLAIQRVPPADQILARNVNAGWIQVPGKSAKAWQVELTSMFILTNAERYSVAAKVLIPKPDNPTSSSLVQAPPAELHIDPPPSTQPPESKARGR